MRWPVVPLGDVAVSVRNGIFARRPTDEPGGSRILRISAVRDGRVNLDDVKYVMGLDSAQIDRFTVASGDLLVTRYNGSRALVGTSGIVAQHEGSIIHPDKLIRVVIDRSVADPWFVNYQMQSPQVRTHLEPRIRTTAGQSGIAGGDLRSIPLVLPPVNEQRRIVDVLEDHLSRLDAADTYLRTAAQRLLALRGETAAQALTSSASTPRTDAELERTGTDDGDLASLPLGWSWARLGDVAEVVGGVTKDSKKQSDPSYVEVPYLRVANVQRGRLMLNEVTTIRVAPAKAKALRLERGDVLLNEGGDRDKLARGWVWEGQIPNCIHQNHVFRARITDSRVDPYFLSWTANTFGGRWAERNGKQSVNLASISLSMIRRMPVIVPPLGEACRVAEMLRDRRAEFDRVDGALQEAKKKATLLRTSILAAAFGAV